LKTHNPKALDGEGWGRTKDRGTLYQDPTTPQRKYKLQRALRELGPGSKILDFGCGRGEFTSHLATLGFQAVGLDISPQAVEFNQRDYPHLEFVQVDPEAPAPFPDGCFDAIWSSEVIEHVYDVHGIFAEFARLLRPGGRLVVTTPYHGWLKNLLVITFAFERHFNVE
jgi:2-polyprenyl-3-methyl-5-hydroxy-6-metoxy-1,4-benzoquinol methylase